MNGKDVSGGWKVHRVTGVDMEKNTITLDGVTVSISIDCVTPWRPMNMELTGESTTSLA